jgi:hypothetical protein
MATSQTLQKDLVAPAQNVLDIEHSDPAALKEQISAISSDKLKQLLEDEAELRAEVERLSSIKGEEKKLEMKEASLVNVRAELMKRGEDMASMSSAIAAHAESFGHHTVDAYKDTDEDTAKRENAGKRLSDARESVGKAKAKLESLDLVSPSSTASTAKAEIEESWNFLTKTTRLEKFMTQHAADVISAETELETAEAAVISADENILLVAEQTELDKRDRIKNASLEQTYEFIASLVSASVKILDGDIADYDEAVTRTNQSLSGAIAKRRDVSQALRDAQDELAKKQREKADIDRDLEDFTDRTDPQYQGLSVTAETLTAEISHLTNEVQLQEGVFSDMELAVKENQASIAAMTMQKRLAERHRNKFRAIERTARDIGQNLVLMVKGMSREGIMESLDKGTNKMSVAVFDAARKVQISAARQLSDMVERRVDVMKELEEINKSADGVLADEVKRYSDVAEKMRRGYGEQGLDVENMSSLSEAAALFGVTEEDSKAQEGDIY